MVVRDLAGTFIRNLPGIIGDLVPPGATEITPFRRPIALGYKSAVHCAPAFRLWKLHLAQRWLGIKE